MKILYVTPYLPGPPVFGGQRRIHGLMNALSKSHQVSLLSLVDAAADISASLRDASQFCQSVTTVPDRLHRVSGGLKRVFQMWSLVSSQSWEQWLHRRPAVQRALDDHLSRNHYDIVNCEFVFMGGYRFDSARRHAHQTRIVLDEHNVEYDILQRTAVATRFDRKLYNTVNYQKLKREELSAWAAFDGCTFTSERDAGLAQREVPTARTCVIPNGVDVDAFGPRQEDVVSPKTVLFFGALNYFPNADAVRFFLDEVLPLLVARCPEVVIRIVGPGASDELKDHGDKRVEVVGFVDDLRAEIARAAVVVAPLRIGGGTRLKIVEAMAVGRPIVATTIGAEGLDVEHEREILLADSAAALAHEIARVLDDASLAGRLGTAGRRTAEARYSWNAAAHKLSAFYESLLSA